jgi:hypothetical protein
VGLSGKLGLYRFWVYRAASRSGNRNLRPNRIGLTLGWVVPEARPICSFSCVVAWHVLNSRLGAVGQNPTKDMELLGFTLLHPTYPNALP